ncbi:MAG: hypothetical protein IJ344_05615 [Clostridia bacterium]|nr:hypothetical protein [Clostridia bacterium]
MTKFQTNEFLNSYNEAVVLQGNAYTYRLSPESFISFVLTSKKLVFITNNGSNVRILPVSQISGVRTGIGSGSSFAVYVSETSGKNDFEFLFPQTVDGSVAQKALVMAISSLL